MDAAKRLAKAEHDRLIQILGASPPKKKKARRRAKPRSAWEFALLNYWPTGKPTRIGWLTGELTELRAEMASLSDPLLQRERPRQAGRQHRISSGRALAELGASCD
jgi:hypothetical protein